MNRKERLDFLVQFASKLDKLGLHDLASKVDSVLKAECEGIEAIISIYRDLHQIRSKKELQRVITSTLRKDDSPDVSKCPFGLPIPRACKYAGDSVLEMSARPVEFRYNRKLYNKKRGRCTCPYALQILSKKHAVRCSYGTINSGIPHWEQFSTSPFYPKLWQGFNLPDVVMNRNYYAYNDFNYYSLY